jgi:hypothetical protein
MKFYTVMALHIAIVLSIAQAGAKTIHDRAHINAAGGGRAKSTSRISNSTIGQVSGGKVSSHSIAAQFGFWHVVYALSRHVTATNTITIRKFQDTDGNPNTIESPKAWHLSLYRNSIAPANLVDSANANHLTVTNLLDGTYIACEADSGAGWVRLNGNHSRYDTLVISAGISIVDTFINFRPNSIVIAKLEDIDGNFSTSIDRIAKPWYVEIHRDSASGLLAYQSNTSADSVPGLGDGTYVIVEADSVNWIHLGYLIGVVPAANGANHISVTMINGQVATVTFVNAPPAYSQTYRTFSASQLEFDDQRNPVRRTRPGRPVIMPNTANLVDEILRQSGNPLKVGLSGQLDTRGRELAYLRSTRQVYVAMTLLNKGLSHTGTPRGLDYYHDHIQILRAVSYVLPQYHNNRLLANLLLLQINIAASDLGKTPPGFADLTYNEGFGNRLNGKTIAEIANYGDSAITRWQVFAPGDFINLDNTVAKINDSFSKPLPFDASDTISWIAGSKLSLTGVRPLITVPFLHKVPGTKPRITPAPQQMSEQTPSLFELAQNYPNPFNPITVIEFSLPDPSSVTLIIYNVLGQQVATLIDHENMQEGTQVAQFDGQQLASGVYFYKLVANGLNENGAQINTFQSVKKMVLVK